MTWANCHRQFLTCLLVILDTHKSSRFYKYLMHCESDGFVKDILTMTFFQFVALHLLMIKRRCLSQEHNCIR